jgi:hypothetical protein
MVIAHVKDGKVFTKSQSEKNIHQCREIVAECTVGRMMCWHLDGVLSSGFPQLPSPFQTVRLLIVKRHGGSVLEAH